ncbi:hypothetical protein [Polynucleobacter sp. UK-Kesae-W10]|nr:hypothetical protein [Polynucleobacter sp. UK-Kesae-W10]
MNGFKNHRMGKYDTLMTFLNKSESAYPEYAIQRQKMANFSQVTH